MVEDLRSRNGIRCDGVRALGKRFVLMPGMEIGFGSLTLVAENATLIRLRGYLSRVLGWDAASLEAVDLAVRAIRAVAARRGPLVLAGLDDLVAIARQIHVRTTPSTAAFVVCARRSREADIGVRVTATIADASTALERARGGTVCVRTNDLPAGYDSLEKAASAPLAPAQLYICAQKAPKRKVPVTPVAPPIVVPKLTRRTSDDIHRIVREYALDAIREFGANPSVFTDKECDWVASTEATSFADIEIATLRIVAHKTADGVTEAAARLGLSHVALGNWLRRRGLGTDKPRSRRK